MKKEMNIYTKTLSPGAILLAAIMGQMLTPLATPAQAARFKSQTAESLPAPTGDESSAIVDFLAADAIPAHNVHCLPIHYRALLHNRCFRGASDKMVLLVEDPCHCGCYAQVPVCLPTCCVGAPHVCAKPGVLGRRRVSYTWDCGFAVEVIFRTRGDLVVLH